MGGARADEKPGADLLSEPARGSGSPVVAAAGAAGHSGQALVLGMACLRGAGDYLVAMLVSSCVVRGGELIVEASVKMAGKARARRAARSRRQGRTRPAPSGRQVRWSARQPCVSFRCRARRRPAPWIRIVPG